jgi:hypothetical protein
MNAKARTARQIRIGDDWYDFDDAAKANDTERAALVREFIRWYCRKPGSAMPKRPDAGPWSEDRPAGDQ